jgi:hypothetical protein
MSMKRLIGRLEEAKKVDPRSVAGSQGAIDAIAEIIAALKQAKQSADRGGEEHTMASEALEGMLLIQKDHKGEYGDSLDRTIKKYGEAFDNADAMFDMNIRRDLYKAYVTSNRMPLGIFRTWGD